jgi:ABC-type transport system substrate-binding protein
MTSNLNRGCAWMLAACLVAVGGAHAAADPAKVLRIAIPRAETGFDPAQASEIYSGAIIAAIMEPLLTFDYLARPAKVAPLTAEALPVVAQNGKRFTFKLRKGTFFAADPAFNGKRRELTAADYVYAIKRLVDPRNRSPNAFYVAGKIVGLDELVASAKRNSDRFDYDAPVAGLETLDGYTLRITLTKSDYTFSQVMALPQLAAVAREVVDAYAGEIAAHPVGTSPYLLKKWVPASKMILRRIRLSRIHVEFQAGRRSGRQGDRGENARQADASGRYDRRQRDGGSAVAVARVPARRARPARPTAGVRPNRAAERQARA